ncbi:autotransporter domain-containing protein [Ruegeria sp. SCSIO 43209]|uniref:autotransporter domain-containing protein n=1 Tax=Ruegeria sp. SCSIO 43209 TaxID=2793010 RepID=UPI001479CBE8|nr:autotransporter domain-containing protein [Ruegeria sp. SCSIO 43209]UAB90282.1 autotransporter domain-containing protein [Ruegeria sp. SCSIO 43209]
MRFIFLFIMLLLAQSASAQSVLERAFEKQQQENAAGSLAILGLAGIPDDSASAISLQSNTDNRDYDFKSAQLGGGFRLAEGVPIYLEGYIGYARYDPVLTFSGTGDTTRIPLKWTSLALTGGVGYQFDIGEYWKMTPMAHISVGRTQSDASVGAQAIANRLGLDRDFLESGGIWAGGAGGSMTVSYEKALSNDREFEASLRYTHIEYWPIGDNEDLLVESTAANAVLWSRYRFPTGKRMFGRPVRWVGDLSLSYLIGDQSLVLGTDWLARVGGGIEVDLSDTWVPWVSTTRFMVRYYGSDTVNGFSAGIGISF